MRGLPRNPLCGQCNREVRGVNGRVRTPFISAKVPVISRLVTSHVKAPCEYWPSRTQVEDISLATSRAGRGCPYHPLLRAHLFTHHLNVLRSSPFLFNVETSRCRPL